MSCGYWLLRSSVSNNPLFLSGLWLLSLWVGDVLATGCSTHIPSEMAIPLLFLLFAWLLASVLLGLPSGYMSNESSRLRLLDFWGSPLCFMGRFSSFLPELSDDVKELSTEHIVPLICFLSTAFRLKPPASVNSEIEGLGQPVLTIETSWESSAFASSTPREEELYPESVSWAFCNTVCKYFPWASILSCKCLCTWNHNSNMINIKCIKLKISILVTVSVYWSYLNLFVQFPLDFHLQLESLSNLQASDKYNTKSIGTLWVINFHPNSSNTWSISSYYSLFWVSVASLISPLKCPSTAWISL